METRVVRIKELSERLGVSRATLWRWERRGLLPPKRHLGPNVVGWLQGEVEDWLRTRPTGLVETPEDLQARGART